MREKREILERHADAAMLGRDIGHVLPSITIEPAVGLLDAGDEPQQHRLAGAGGAEHHDDLAGARRASDSPRAPCAA